MPPFLSAYLVTLVLLAAVDLVWLGLVARSFYVAQFGELLRQPPSIPAAALFYAIYSAGIVHFAVLPSLRDGAWVTALGQGAILGFIVYASYDLTNLATLKGWPVALTAADIGWGTVLTAGVAAAACSIVGWLGVRS